MKIFGSTFWLFRAPLAVVGGVIIGQIAQIPLALLIDFIWQNNVTGGRWPLTVPNILLVCLVGLIAGFSAGWLAGRHGKLLGAIAILLPLWLFILLTIIKNVNPIQYLEQTYDTKPALWVYLALIPGIAGGHFGALDGKKYFNRAAFFCSIGFITIFSIGFSLFHLYTGFIAFKIAGFMTTIITLSFPVFAELYWSWRFWNKSGLFINNYTSWIMLLIIFLVIAGIAYIAFIITKEKDQGMELEDVISTKNKG